MSVRPRTLVVLVLLFLIGLFAALNWTAFRTPTHLNLLLARIEAPLGLVMLGVVTVMTALYALFALYVETGALLESRRHARQLEAQRRLAAEAEVSRMTELRTYVEAQMAALHAAPTEAAQRLITRLEATESRLMQEIERTGNTLAAYIGELEDRLTGKEVS
jgi:uncharacterized integral membrane protein